MDTHVYQNKNWLNISIYVHPYTDVGLERIDNEVTVFSVLITWYKLGYILHM